jgi:hypothetical protein
LNGEQFQQPQEQKIPSRLCTISADPAAEPLQKLDGLLCCGARNTMKRVKPSLIIINDGKELGKK